jgi:carbon storage regulator
MHPTVRQNPASTTGCFGISCRFLVRQVETHFRFKRLRTQCVWNGLFFGAPYRAELLVPADHGIDVRPAIIHDERFTRDWPMLVLSRKKDEKIVIGDNITLMVIEIRGDKVRLGIEAPRDVTVHREEVYEAIKRESSDEKKSS